MKQGVAELLRQHLLLRLQRKLTLRCGHCGAALLQQKIGTHCELSQETALTLQRGRLASELVQQRCSNELRQKLQLQVQSYQFCY